MPDLNTNMRLFCAIGYAVTWYFTTKKLNLE